MHARAQLAVCMRAAGWPGNTTLYEIQNSCMGPAARACCIVLVTQVHSRLSVPVPVGTYRDLDILWAAEFVLWV